MTTWVDPIRQYVRAEGVGKNGFFRYQVEVEKGGLALRSLKGELSCTIDDETEILQHKEPFLLHAAHYQKAKSMHSRLDLGINKSPNWSSVTQRSDILEIIQHWYHIADPVALAPPSHSLLGAVVQAVNRCDKEGVLESIHDFYRAAITDFFVPKKEDDLFLGYDIPPLDENEKNPHGIMVTCISSLFVQEQGRKIAFLPCLPKSVPSGRLLHKTLSSGHTMDLEWRKGGVRRVRIRADHDDKLLFSAKPKNCFLRKGSLKAKKFSHLLSTPLEVKAGETYLLDNFC